MELIEECSRNYCQQRCHIYHPGNPKYLLLIHEPYRGRRAFHKHGMRAKTPIEKKTEEARGEKGQEGGDEDGIKRWKWWKTSEKNNKTNTYRTSVGTLRGAQLV